MTRTAKIGIGRMKSSAIRRTVTPHDAFVTYWTRTKKRLPSARLKATKKREEVGEGEPRRVDRGSPYAAMPSPSAPDGRGDLPRAGPGATSAGIR